MPEPTPTPPTPPGPTPAPGPAGPPAGAGVPPLPSMKKEDRPDFRVIRSAPPPPSGSGVMPFALLALVLALGIGGWLLARRQGTGTKTGTDTSTTSAKPAKPLPDFMRERLDFLVNEGNLEAALNYALEKKVELELDNCAELDQRIDQLRKELGVTPDDPEAALRDAAQKVEAKQWAEALEVVTPFLDDATLPDALKGQAYYIAAECYANADPPNNVDAKSAVDSAKGFGYDAAKCAALETKYGL